MKKSILFNATATEKKAALLEDGRIVELVVERPDDYRILGNIYRGRINSILPGIQSAFVDIGFGQSGFLHASDVDASLLLEEDDDRIERFINRTGGSKRKRVPRVPIEDLLEVGQSILVQVIKEPIANKSPKLSTQISLAGRFLVLVPDSDFIGVSKKTSDFKKRRRLKALVNKIRPEGVGFIVRTIGLKVAEDALVNEMKHLITQWQKTQKAALTGVDPVVIYKEQGITTRVIRDLFSDDVTKVYVDQKKDYQEIVAYIKALSPSLVNRVTLYTDETRLFDKFNIEKDVDRSIKRKVWLKKGGYLFFDHAEALLAIDVNTGRNVGKNDLEETVFQTNMEAATEICRQLRLRDIGGIIVVDFIDMRRTENKRKVENEMRTLLEKDSSNALFTPLSKFGLMEITRKRVRPELQALFTNVCPTCYGLGRIYSPATVSARIDRWLGRAEMEKITKNLTLTVSQCLSDYLLADNNRILNGLKKAHGFTLKVIIDNELDIDEFEIFKDGEKKHITDQYS